MSTAKALELQYSPAQLAVILGVTKQTVLARINAGEIAPAYQLDKKTIRVPSSAVAAYLEHRRIRTP